MVICICMFVINIHLWEEQSNLIVYLFINGGSMLGHSLNYFMNGRTIMLFV